MTTELAGVSPDRLREPVTCLACHGEGGHIVRIPLTLGEDAVECNVCRGTGAIPLESAYHLLTCLDWDQRTETWLEETKHPALQLLAEENA